MLLHPSHDHLNLPPGARLARLARVDRTSYEVLTDDGPLRVPLLPPPEQGVVGDWLALDGDRAVALLPRRTLLARAAVAGTSTTQPLAANVDVALICAGLSAPVTVRRIERLLTLVWDSGATPVVVLTKADLHPDPAAEVSAVAPYAPGADVVAVSAEQGDVAALGRWTRAGMTLVLLGASGTGKSTLLNALAGAPVMPTGAVRAVDGKGRHTTSARQLVPLPGGAVVIDTPGLRGVAVPDATDGLARAFSDVEELAAACRFADCRHTGEPGCAVAASIEAGDLAPGRVDSWRRLQREMAYHARRTDARLRAEERARWRAEHRARRGLQYRP